MELPWSVWFFYIVGKYFFLLLCSLLVVGVLIKFLKKIFGKKAKNFRNQIVLITGAANGLGKILTRKFLEMGCVVVMWDIDNVNGEKTLEEYRKKFSNVKDRLFFFRVDLSEKEEIRKYAEIVKNRVGEVDVLINNAGIVAKQTIFDVSDELAELVMKVNVISHFHTVKAFVPGMKKRDRGHIVTIASAASTVGVAGMQVYCASKFGCFGFAESLRLQLRRDNNNNVDTLIVCPGYMKGQMFKNVRTLRLFPLLEMEWVADRTIKGMKNRETEIIMPWYGRTINYALRMFFHEYSDAVQHALNMTHSMDDILKKQ